MAPSNLQGHQKTGCNNLPHFGHVSPPAAIPPVAHSPARAQSLSLSESQPLPPTLSQWSSQEPQPRSISQGAASAFSTPQTPVRQVPSARHAVPAPSPDHYGTQDDTYYFESQTLEPFAYDRRENSLELPVVRSPQQAQRRLSRAESEQQELPFQQLLLWLVDEERVADGAVLSHDGKIPVARLKVLRQDGTVRLAL